MARKRIVVEIQGGCVQAVHATENEHDTQVIIVDWDEASPCAWEWRGKTPYALAPDNTLDEIAIWAHDNQEKE